MRLSGSSRSLRLPAALAVLGAAAVVFGPGGAGCLLSSAIDDVLLPPGAQSSSGADVGAGGAGGAAPSTSTTPSASSIGAGGAGGAGAGDSSSGSGSGGSGGILAAEACMDGVDNDGDGLADCADADCAPGFACIDAAPAVAASLYRVKQYAASDVTSPGCSDGITPELYQADPAGPAECSPCSCGAPVGATCQPPPFACFAGSTNCQGSPKDWTAAATAAACAKPTNLLGNSQTLSCVLTGPAVVTPKGACQPSAVDFPNKDTWGSKVVACLVQEAGGGCGGGEVCVPKPQRSGPTERVCLKQEVGQPCPSGWSSALPAFTGAIDTRGCDACQCGDPPCSGGSYSFFDLDMCDPGSEAPVSVTSNACKNVSPLLDSGTWSVSAKAPQVAGPCQPSGGQPTGAVETAGAVMFCCK